LARGGDQFSEFEKVFKPKQRSTGGEADKGVFGHNIGPGGWDRSEFPILIVKVDAIFAPVMAVNH
jgi:hypothetical protein